MREQRIISLLDIRLKEYNNNNNTVYLDNTIIYSFT